MVAAPVGAQLSILKIPVRMIGQIVRNNKKVFDNKWELQNSNKICVCNKKD